MGRNSRLRITYGSQTLSYEVMDQSEVEKMWKEWEEEPLVMIPKYFAIPKEEFERDYPGIYDLREKMINEIDKNAMKEYAQKLFPDREDRDDVINRLFENMVNMEENYVVIRNVAISEPQVGVNSTYGEKVGKSILAEELGGHFICQAFQVRKFERDIEKAYRERNKPLDLPRMMSTIDALFYSDPDPKLFIEEIGLEAGDGKLYEEAVRAQKIAHHYATSAKSVRRYLKDGIISIEDDLDETIEAGAMYLRTKLAEKILGTKGASGTFFSVDRCDPVYLRAEEKIKRFLKSKGMDEEEAKRMAEKDVVKNYIMRASPLKSKLMPELFDIETDIEKEYKREMKNTQRDMYIMTGSIIGASIFLGASPFIFLYNATPIGGAIMIPYSMSVRALRRLPGRVKRALEESDSPTAKKLLEGGGKVKNAVKKPFEFVYEHLEENEYAIKIGRAFKGGAKAIGHGVKEGAIKIGHGVKDGINNIRNWRKADEPEAKVVERSLERKITTKLDNATGNRWSKFQKKVENTLDAFYGVYQMGLIPLPGSRVLDMYGYGDNALVKKKFTKEKVRESFDEIVSYLDEMGVEKELLEEFGKHKDQIKILDNKDLKSSRGIMSLLPRYYIDEIGVMRKLAEEDKNS